MKEEMIGDRGIVILYANQRVFVLRSGSLMYFSVDARGRCERCTLTIIHKILCVNDVLL